MVDILVGWVADLIGELLDEALKYLAPLLGFSFQRFVDTFPYANTVYLVFQRCALCLVLVIAVVHLWCWFFPSDARARTPPTRIAFCVILAVGFIYFGNYLLEGILNLCIYPYEAIVGGNADQGAMPAGLGLGDLLSDSFAGMSLVLYIIVFVMIAVAFLKLMLESVERYIVLFLLVYASPLAAATLASDATNGIYKRFFTMFVSQCVLMILNIWILKLAISMFENLGSNGDPFLALIMGWGLLKVGARMDSYINQLGLNAAVTGMGLAGEIGAVAGGLMMARQFAGKGGGGFGKSGGGNGGGLMGAAKKLTSTVDKVNPASMLGKGAVNYGGALLKSTVGKDGLVGSAINRMKGNGAAPKGTWKKKFGENMKAAGLRTQDQNALARGIGGSAKRISDRFAGAGLSSSDRANLANYAHVADNAFHGAAVGEIHSDEPESVGAVMQGIGFESASEDAGGFIDAAYGNNSNADNLHFDLDESGISASYTENGTLHEAQIVDANQYGKLSTEEQHGFTPFKSDNGNTYYYQTSASRIPSSAQVAADNFSASAERFASRPHAGMSSSDFAYMAKHPETVNQVFDGLQRSGVQIQDQQQVGYMLQAMQTPSIPAKAKSDAVNAMFAGEATNARIDHNGMDVSFISNDGKNNNITILTEKRIGELGADYVANRGYTMKNVDGRQYGFLYEKGDAIHDANPTAKP